MIRSVVVSMRLSCGPASARRVHALYLGLWSRSRQPRNLLRPAQCIDGPLAAPAPLRRDAAEKSGNVLQSRRLSIVLSANSVLTFERTAAC